MPTLRKQVRVPQPCPVPAELEHLVRLRVMNLPDFHRLLAVHAGRSLTPRALRARVKPLYAEGLIALRRQDTDRRHLLVFPAPAFVPARPRPLLRGDHGLPAHCIASEVFVVLAERGASARFVFWDTMPGFVAEFLPPNLPGLLFSIRGIPAVSGRWVGGAVFSSAQATRTCRIWSRAAHPLFPSDISFALVLGRGPGGRYPDFSAALASIRPFRNRARWCFVPGDGLSIFGLLAGAPYPGESLEEVIGGFLSGAALERPVHGCPDAYIVRGRNSHYLAIDLRAADARTLVFLAEELTSDVLSSLGCSGVLAVVSSGDWAHAVSAVIGVRDWLWYLVPAGGSGEPGTPVRPTLVRIGSALSSP